MDVRRHDRSDFLDAVQGFLVCHEAMNNLVLGLAHTLRTNPTAYVDSPYLAAVEAHGQVMLVALRTPPHPLVLSWSEPGPNVGRALDVLVEDVAAAFPRLPGVLGPKGVVEPFLRRWSHRTGQRGRLVVAERIYELTTVNPPPLVPGAMRETGPTDVPLLRRWLRAFTQEALSETADVDQHAEETLRHRLSNPGSAFYLWEDETAVCLAGYSGPTPTGIRIGPVYTPPEQRGRGYASILVAQLSQRLLDGGRTRCFLFTDLSNPTSNGLYQRIGYRPVGDVDQFVFDDGENP